MRTFAGFLCAGLLAAGSARAIAVAGSSTTPEESATGPAAAAPPAFGTGWSVGAGYWFKDTMFYSDHRGGLAAHAGKTWALPYGLGLWAGGGAMRGRGLMDSLLADGDRWRTDFDIRILYADVGLLTPFTPFPVCLVIYRQSADVADTALTGPLTGARLTKTDASFGAGLDVHLTFEWFFLKREDRTRGRGPALLLEYIGFMDLSARDLTTTDAAGRATRHGNWKPLKGESLQTGLEWEF